MVGIDIHQPALELAARNIAAAGLTDRIELRHQDVRELPAAEHDLVWLPGPFLPHAIVTDALAAANRALRPGGWVAFGIYGGPADSEAQRLADLRTIRNGGYPWASEEAVAALRGAEFAEVAEVRRDWQAPVRLVVGRRPA